MGRRGAARPAGLSARPRPRRAWPPAGQRAASPPPPPLRCAGAAPARLPGRAQLAMPGGCCAAGTTTRRRRRTRTRSKLFLSAAELRARERAAPACGRSPGPRGLAGAGLLAAEANHQRARLSAGRGPLLRGGERPRAQVALPRGGAVGAAPCRQQQVAERRSRDLPEVLRLWSAVRAL